MWKLNFLAFLVSKTPEILRWNWNRHDESVALVNFSNFSLNSMELVGSGWFGSGFVVAFGGIFGWVASG